MNGTHSVPYPAAVERATKKEGEIAKLFKAKLSMVKKFSTGDRVMVSSTGGWRQTFSGVICGGPEPIDTLKGPENFYWVQFDEPQEDVNSDDKYYKAQILSCYIEHAV